MTAVTLHVTGTPAPKGSPRIVTRGRGGRPLPRPRVLDDSERTTAWGAAVRAEALRAMVARLPFANDALEVAITFRMRRPLGHFDKRGYLKASAPALPAVKPDLDKLIRTTFDALQPVVIDEDSRIVYVAARKVYASAADGYGEGATITVGRAA